MYWNNRVLQRIDNAGTDYEETNLYIVEIYYNTDDDTVIGWTEKEYVWGDDIESLRQSLTWMLDALDKPILIETDLFQQVHENPRVHIDQEEFLTLNEVLDSLGLDRDDVGRWDDDGGSL